MILKLFLNTQGVALPKCVKNKFQSILMFYYIIKPSKSLYSYRQCNSASESSTISKIQKSSYALMKLELRIIFKMFLNFSYLTPH